MGCNSMQPGSKFNQSLFVQPEMMNCPPDKQNMGLCSEADIEALLADAGYSVKAPDLALVAQRLEQLDSICATAAGVLSHLPSEPVHYYPSDMASWVENLLEELAPPTPVGQGMSSAQENAFPPQTPLHYALEDGYGPFSCSCMGRELCMDKHSSSQQVDTRASFANWSTKQSAPSTLIQPSVESAPSISQLIKDSIGHNGASSATSNGPQGLPRDDDAQW